MPFSHSSNLENNSAGQIATPPFRKRESLPIRVVTWIVRELTGAVFIFSGFTKAIDPWGTLYKIQDYLSVMGLDIWPGLMKVGAFLLCAVEFLVGAMLCLGSFRRTAAWAATAIMCVMLPLTLWIAMYNPVADCGCFGEAFILSNWATFWKNVVLMAATIWLSIFNRRAGWLVAPYLQWIALVVSGVFVMCVEAAGYLYQPLIDFRPYPVGGPVIDEVEETEPEFIFVYEKDGVRREYSASDSLPDEADGWKFVERKETGPLSDGIDIKIIHEQSLRLWDPESEEDATEEALTPEGDRLILVMPELGKVSIASTWKINSLYDWANRHDIDMIAIVAATPEEIDNWKDLSMPQYPIYSSEDTVLKQLVRGNPGVVFMRDGIIEWKSTLRALNTDDFMDSETGDNPLSFKRNDRVLLANISAIYCAILAFLIVLSFFFRMRRIRQKLIQGKILHEGKISHDEKLTHDDKALPEESSSPDTPAQ